MIFTNYHIGMHVKILNGTLLGTVGVVVEVDKRGVLVSTDYKYSRYSPTDLELGHWSTPIWIPGMKP